jgi:hypothetical protein
VNLLNKASHNHPQNLAPFALACIVLVPHISVRDILLYLTNRFWKTRALGRSLRADQIDHPSDVLR